MFADDTWSQCNTRVHYGVYIWTAGQWINPKSKSPFVWKVAGESPKAMRYTNWHNGEDPQDQPDNVHGNEACINLWKNYRYAWNDETCSNKYCFVCENYRIPVWGTPGRSALANSLQRCA